MDDNNISPTTTNTQSIFTNGVSQNPFTKSGQTQQKPHEIAVSLLAAIFVTGGLIYAQASYSWLQLPTYYVVENPEIAFLGVLKTVLVILCFLAVIFLLQRKKIAIRIMLVALGIFLAIGVTTWWDRWDTSSHNESTDSGNAYGDFIQEGQSVYVPNYTSPLKENPAVSGIIVAVILCIIYRSKNTLTK